MEFYELKKIWLCKIAATYRNQENGTMVLYEEPSLTYLLIEDEKIMNLTAEEGEKPIYRNLSGDLFYDGVDKIWYRVEDLNKMFVIERSNIPKEELTFEEIETRQISHERIKELEKKFRKFHNYYWLPILK